MYPEYAIYFLIAAVLCSFVGRIVLVGNAFAKGTQWGMIVLFAPFGPMIFRFKYEDLAIPTRYYRMPVGPLVLLFFVMGGSVYNVPHALMALSKPDMGGLFGHKDAAVAVVAPAATPAPMVAQATPGPKATPASAPVVAKATPSPAVKAAAAGMAAAPTILDLNQRLNANRQEFARLADWYDSLKHERGYLRKGDTDAVEAYNEEAAKYQSALQLAKAEEAELTKLVVATAKK